ncbi:signal peptidase I [Candidatus Parcubacteria bacterium]|nr:signal peptidase I [Candidatus Parcubacteria bacterium]
MKLFKISSNIFFVCIGIIAILLIATMFPITGNFKVKIVQSGSMQPAIKTGSIVVIKPVKEYKAGDVITFGAESKGKTPTTHRIQEIINDNGVKTYTTKGDANNSEDAKKIKEHEIIGKVLFSVPFVGYAVATAKKPWGFILIIGIPALIIILDEGKKIWVEVRRIRKLPP